MIKLLLLLLKVTFLVSLPFIILIRGSIFLHLNNGLNPWFALLLAIFITAFILIIYFNLVLRQWIGVKKVSRRFYKIQSLVIVGLVLFYCTYGVVSFSKTNAKTKRQHSEYTNLHPHLRIALSTVIFLDMKLVVTDMGREKLDYRLMGLPKKERSMHYQQKDGYIHAVDLRTTHRSEFRNFLVKSYFSLMGFGTLRHTGTADHLHISIPTRENLRAL